MNYSNKSIEVPILSLFRQVLQLSDIFTIGASACHPHQKQTIIR